MLPRRNRPYAAWARTAIDRVPGLQRLRRGWIYAFCETLTFGLTSAPPIAAALKAFTLGFLRRSVRDPELRRKLTPDYDIGCKRILFSSRFYPALQRPNVELVTDGIREITPTGIVTDDGTEREVDTIVFGTGFKAQQFVLPMSVRGAGGRELQEGWGTGAEAHHGMTVAGFPNLFVLYGPNTNLSVGSIVVMIEAQAAYVRRALALARERGVDALDVRPEVQAASNEGLQRDFEGSVWTGCSSWYRNASGRVVSNWPHRMREYQRLVADVRPDEFREVRAAEAVQREPAGVGD
jgi:cation diffusion facilitator CzcD-associated flavoprotein CzcO